MLRVEYLRRRVEQIEELAAFMPTDRSPDDQIGQCLAPFNWVCVEAYNSGDINWHRQSTMTDYQWDENSVRFIPLGVSLPPGQEPQNSGAPLSSSSAPPGH